MNQPNIQGIYNQFMQNPMAMLSKRFNIPADLNNPNEIIQHLLNTGQVSQAQVNRIMQMRNNPVFKNMF